MVPVGHNVISGDKDKRNAPAVSAAIGRHARGVLRGRPSSTDELGHRYPGVTPGVNSGNRHTVMGGALQGIFRWCGGSLFTILIVWNRVLVAVGDHMAMMKRSRLFFEPISRKARASQYRIDADIAHRRGFPGMAEVLWELAEWIDPTPRVKPEPVRRQQRQPSQHQGNAGMQPRKSARLPQSQGVATNVPQSIRNPNGVAATGGGYRGSATPRASVSRPQQRPMGGTRPQRQQHTLDGR